MRFDEDQFIRSGKELICQNLGMEKYLNPEIFPWLVYCYHIAIQCQCGYQERWKIYWVNIKNTSINLHIVLIFLVNLCACMLDILENDRQSFSTEWTIYVNQIHIAWQSQQNRIINYLTLYLWISDFLSANCSTHLILNLRVTSSFFLRILTGAT